MCTHYINSIAYAPMIYLEAQHRLQEIYIFMYEKCLCLISYFWLPHFVIAEIPIYKHTSYAYGMLAFRPT